VPEEMEESRHTSTGVEVDKQEYEVICPVCGKRLHENNLVDRKSVVEDNLYYVGGVRIVNSRVQLHCDFEHQFNIQGIRMDKSHPLVAVVEAVFDAKACTNFEIVEILPG
jgi:hypothetical protein